MPTQINGPLVREYLLRFGAIFAILFAPFYIFYGDRLQPIPLSSLAIAAFYFALASAVLVLLIRRTQGFLATAVFTVSIVLFLDIQYDRFGGLPLLAAALLVAAALWFLRNHAGLILAVVFMTMLAASIAVVTFKLGSSAPDLIASGSGVGTVGQGPDERPVIVHLILDEHAGIAGIPPNVPGGSELRQSLQDLYQSNGFRLFGNAVSEYVSSKNSISGILNFSSGTQPEQWYHGKKPYVLGASAYFDLLNESGYELSVYQSSYMDFCTEFPEIVSRCHTYRYDGAGWLKDSQLTDREKFLALFGMYMSRSKIFEAVSKLYSRVSRAVRPLGLRLPPLAAWNGSAASLSSLAVFDALIDEISQGPGGRVYFAHILLPHGPYVFDSDCRLQPDISEWMGNVPLHSKFNTEESRERRYARYFEQIACVHSKLETLFDRMKATGRFAEATIVIHGDHGSRIYVTEPKSRNAESLAPRDYLDSFSTLFAVKTPGLAPGYDETQAPVSQLLGLIARSGELPSNADQSPIVYLEGSDDEDWVQLPWPKSE
jgi:hypothetical protein